MDIKQTWKEFDRIKHELHDSNRLNRHAYSKTEGLAAFGRRTIQAIRLVFLEKELISFALFQWVAIAVGYLLWVQMLGWIPEEVWRSAAESDDGSIADIILLLWSFVCVGVAAFPLAIATACMGAVHFIHRQQEESTIATCLQIVLPKAWSLWIFTWIDGWITVDQILERLPKKNDRTTPTERALSEALYYAWKVGTMGVLPSLITGRSIVAAGKDSLSLIKHKLREIALLRAGYSAVCWVVGILTYVGSIWFLFHFQIFQEGELYGQVFTIYLWLAVPILISAAFIQLFIRPIYILSLCDIYSDYLEETKQEAMLPVPPSGSTSAIIAFVCLCILVAVIFWFRYELGIMDMLATEYGETYSP